MEIHKVIIANFNFKIGVFICPAKKLKRWLKTTYKRNCPVAKTSGGCVFSIPKEKDIDLFMWLREYEYGADKPVIAHESNHATYAAFEHIGEKEINPDSEAYCTTLDYIVRKVLEINDEQFPFADIQGVMTMFRTINMLGSDEQKATAQKIFFEGCEDLELIKRRAKLQEFWFLYSRVEKANLIHKPA